MQKILIETKVKANLRKICLKHNIMLIHYAQNGRGITGFPDYIAITSTGNFFVIECKGSNRNLSPAQSMIKERLEARNVKYYIYRGSTEDDDGLIDLVKEFQ